MNILQIIKILLLGSLVSVGIAWTVIGGIKSNDKLGLSSPTQTVGVAPEIDAASGTSAIALLTGALLLAAERSRYRRP